MEMNRDTIEPRIPLLLSTLVSSFAVFVVWGLGRGYWVTEKEQAVASGSPC